jgi:hypothetical protein
MRDLLDFDDAGAGDDEPTKGVLIGHIREWHDEMDRLRIAIHGVCLFNWSDCGPNRVMAIDTLRNILVGGMTK